MRSAAARSPAAVFFVSLALLAALQAARVARVHDGDWTGPFLVGDRQPLARVAWPMPVAVRAGSDGYDGQFYLALALDPFLRTPLTRAIDDPRYRAHRIAWPLAAWLLGGGQPLAVLAALHLLLLLAVAAGGWAVARWAVAHGASALWGYAWVFALGTLVSVERMLGDAVMVSLLLVGIVLARERGPRAHTPAGLLALAVLQKETAILAASALVAPVPPPERRRAALRLLLALAPIAAWWLYVAARTDPGAPVFAINFAAPGTGIARAVADSITCGPSPFHLSKDLAFLGLHLAAIVLGLAVGCRGLARNTRDEGEESCRRGLAAAIFLFALLGLCLARSVWIEPWAYARTLLPLLSLELLFSLLAARAGGAHRRWRRAGRGLALASLAAGLLFSLETLALRTP